MKLDSFESTKENLVLTAKKLQQNNQVTFYENIINKYENFAIVLPDNLKINKLNKDEYYFIARVNHNSIITNQVLEIVNLDNYKEYIKEKDKYESQLGVKIEKFIIAKNIYDCQSFVTDILTSNGLNPINVFPTIDVKNAKKDNLVQFYNSEEILSKKLEPSINKGNIIIFVLDGKKTENDVIKESNKLYKSAHVALSIENNNIIHAQINRGYIVEDQIYDYLVRNQKFKGFYVINSEFYKKPKKNVSSFYNFSRFNLAQMK